MRKSSQRTSRSRRGNYPAPAATVAIAALMMLVPASAYAQGWTDVPIPADPPAGLTWELQPVSDDFSYSSSGGNRPEEFTRRWKDTYINGFSGPSCTSSHRDHVWTDGQHLAVHAN